ncbi:MAG: hypothetical protein AAFU64_12415, partial [Bacteroidota bacterium]
MQKRILPLFTIIILFSCQSQESAINVADYQADLQYLKDSLPVKHPNLFFHQSKVDFYKNIDLIAAEENLSIKSKAQVLL